MTKRAIASIWFPQLAMERHRRSNGPRDAPFALIDEGQHGPTIAAINAAAREAGARVGARMTDARALCPELEVEPSDLAGDAAWLKATALWARRWTPITATDGSDGLLCDLTGTLHLWGGDAACLGDMVQRFAACDMTARAALAPTHGAAWALARFGGNAAVCVNPARELAPLPTAALRLSPDTVLLLRRLGLKTVGALAGLPRDALVRRFRKFDPADNPLIRLDQALGRTGEPLTPVEPEARHRALRRVLEPIRHLELLVPILADLAGDLCELLEDAGHGARRILFEAFRIDGHVARVAVETARPTRDPAHLLRLFDERFDKFDAGFGFDAFALEAVRHEPLSLSQTDLDSEQVEACALPRLIDRLVARLGAANVYRQEARASHIPERSVARAAPLGPATPRQGQLPFHERPMRLLERPEPITVIYATPEGMPRRFRWRGEAHDITRAEGPERIAPEWWREKSTARLRDYYKIEDEAGGRYWVYRGGLVGDGRGDAPGWFMHGFFA